MLKSLAMDVQKTLYILLYSADGFSQDSHQFCPRFRLYAHSSGPHTVQIKYIPHVLFLQRKNWENMPRLCMGLGQCPKEIKSLNGRLFKKSLCQEMYKGVPGNFYEQSHWPLCE